MQEPTPQQPLALQVKGLQAEETFKKTNRSLWQIAIIHMDTITMAIVMVMDNIHILILIIS
jgi:hypothetical protein